jgi:hypothetical protein
MLIFWVLFSGDPLNSIGYEEWAPSNPNNYPDQKTEGLGQDCMSMQRDGLLNDKTCSYRNSFICERGIWSNWALNVKSSVLKIGLYSFNMYRYIHHLIFSYLGKINALKHAVSIAYKYSFLHVFIRKVMGGWTWRVNVGNEKCMLNFGIKLLGKQSLGRPRKG